MMGVSERKLMSFENTVSRNKQTNKQTNLLIREIHSTVKEKEKHRCRYAK